MGKKKRAPIPKFENEIIETHCHLDYLKENQVEELLKQCDDLNIKKIVTISVEPGNLQKVIDLADQHANIYTCQGIHPHEAKDFDEDVHKTILKNIPHPKVMAVGEIGLDYFYNHSDPNVQKPVFETQMQIAIDHDLPVIIHSRDAEDDTIAVLDNMAPKLKRKGVIHSFTSKPELAQKAIDLGFYLGFNGIITFNKAEEVREAVAMTPIEQILIETDSPFLTPVPYRGRENAPIYLPFIAQKIADIKDIDVEEVIKITTKNANDLFQF